MNTTTLSILYRVMVGACGFSFGMAVVLGVSWSVDGIRRRPAYFLWSAAMLGYAMIIAALAPLVLFARNTNAPFNWQSWLFLVGLLLKSVAFLGLFVRRRRGKASFLP